MQIKLIEALSRRKDLQDQVAKLGTIRKEDCYTHDHERLKPADNQGFTKLCEKHGPIPTRAFLAPRMEVHNKLRLVDWAVQKANQASYIEVPRCLMVRGSEGGDDETPFKVQVAEALLRRKELRAWLTDLEELADREVFQLLVRRTPVPGTENLEDVAVAIPLLESEELIKTKNQVSSDLRRLDLAIQQANHTVTLDVSDKVMVD